MINFESIRYSTLLTNRSKDRGCSGAEKWVLFVCMCFGEGMVETKVN